MKTLFLCALLAAAWPSSAQNVTLNLQTGPPAQVAGVGATYTGTRGNAPIYYYVVARYHAGWVLPSKPASAVNTTGISGLGGGNSVHLVWSAAAGATGYDVFALSTASFSGSCANCAVALNTSSTSLTDHGTRVGNYPPGGFFLAGTVTGVGQIDQITEAAPFVNWTMLNQQMRFGFISSYTVGNCPVFATLGGIVVLADSGSACNGGGGSGNVSGGPFASGNVVTGAGGQNVQDSGKAAPAGAFVGTTDTQTLSGKTLTTPTIGSFVNAQHTHANGAGGGQLDNTAVKPANLQGNGTKFQMAGTVAGAAGDPLCRDAGGNSTTAGCTAGGNVSGGPFASGNVVTGAGGQNVQDSGKAAPAGAFVGTTDTQTLSGKTLTTPTIGSFVNAQHTHADAAGGGQLDNTAVKTANQQGNGTSFQMAGVVAAGAGNAFCTDVNGNTTTSGCGAGSSNILGTATWNPSTGSIGTLFTSGAVSSVTYVSTGRYLVALTGTPANYVISASCGDNATICVLQASTTPTNIGFTLVVNGSTGTGVFDPQYVMLAIIKQ